MLAADVFPRHGAPVRGRSGHTAHGYTGRLRTNCRALSGRDGPHRATPGVLLLAWRRVRLLQRRTGRVLRRNAQSLV